MANNENNNVNTTVIKKTGLMANIKDFVMNPARGRLVKNICWMAGGAVMLLAYAVAKVGDSEVSTSDSNDDDDE